MSETIESIRILENNINYKKFDVNNICDQLVDFGRLRISALTKAAEISPQVKEVTIGPNSPIKKETLQLPHIEKCNIDTTVKTKVNRNDLHYTSAKKLYDSKLYENSENIFKHLIDKMVSKRAEFMTQYWQKQSEAFKRQSLELNERKLHMLNELKENDNVSFLENLKQDELSSQYISMKTIENMNQILEEQNRAAARYATITDSQTKICVYYSEINKILDKDNNCIKVVSSGYLSAVNNVLTAMNQIMEICKDGYITDTEVEQAKSLLSTIEMKYYKLKQLVLEESNRIKQEEVNKIEQERETKIKEEEQKKEAALMEEAKVQIEKQRTPPLYYSLNNFAHYEALKKFLLSYEIKYKDLLEDVKMKKYRFDCRKAVNTPLNTICSVSGVHLRDKYDKLLRLLRGEQFTVLDASFSAAQHSQGLPYCTALMAKKIVQQGDTLVSSNPEAAFPIASVAVALWVQFPELGNLIEAYFYKECPYLVPMFLPQMEGMSNKEFYKSRGYLYDDEGVVEKQDKFLKRMSGIFQLRCAMWITKTPCFLKSTYIHPGLKDAWRWLASFINLKPEPDISATLLTNFMTVCGSECHKYYGPQFRKVIHLISTDYIAILDKIDEGGPKTRLEVLLKDILDTGAIAPPKGLLSANSW